jgi:hypothetical protein
MTPCNLVGDVSEEHAPIFMVEICRMRNRLDYVGRLQIGWSLRPTGLGERRKSTDQWERPSSGPHITPAPLPLSDHLLATYLHILAVSLPYTLTPWKWEQQFPPSVSVYKTVPCQLNITTVKSSKPITYYMLEDILSVIFCINIQFFKHAVVPPTRFLFSGVKFT